MSQGNPTPLVVHGWTIFAHPLFLDQIESLIQQADALQQKDPVGYIKKNATKRLAAIAKLAFDIIPQSPTKPEYRQGGTLGEDHKHWFCAKFFQQYRLFFRYHRPSRVIVLAWVNDEDTKRAYESSDDANRVSGRCWPAVIRPTIGISCYMRPSRGLRVFVRQWHRSSEPGCGGKQRCHTVGLRHGFSAL